MEFRPDFDDQLVFFSALWSRMADGGHLSTHVVTMSLVGWLVG